MNEPAPPIPPPSSCDVADKASGMEMSLPARMLNIYAAPAEVFDSIKGRKSSHANWLGPALLLLVVSWLGAWVILSQDAFKQQIREISDKAVERQIKTQHLSEAQAEQAHQMAAITQTVGYVAMPVAMAFFPPFIIALFLWFVAQYALKAPLPYLKVLEITGLAAMISVLETIVRTLLILITGKLMASLSPVLLIKEFDPANALHSLAVFANPLFLWLLMVRAIGLARLTGNSFRKSAAWVFGLWCGYTGFFWVSGWALQQLAKRLAAQ